MGVAYYNGVSDQLISSRLGTGSNPEEFEGPETMCETSASDTFIDTALMFEQVDNAHTEITYS